MAYIKILLLLIITLILPADRCVSQSIIKGTIYDDSTNKSIVGANIFIISKSNNVLTHTQSDTSGAFKLNISEPLDSILCVIANHINYKKKEIPFLINKNTYSFSLVPSAVLLPNITVKSESFVTQRNDTIDYNVSKFSTKSDITIGDVLKKIPGITINTDGKILYGGISINKLYIDGQDLLGSKYNIATTVIPHDLVKVVQVYENHQPIKLLRGKEDTNHPALNLELDSSAKNKLIGIGNIKIGTPNMPTNNSYANMNGLLFKKMVQYLNNIRYDATGSDIKYDITDHGDAGTDNYLVKDFYPISSIQNIPKPNIDLNKWNFNKSILLNINSLYKTSEDQSIRINSYIVEEKKELKYTSLQQITLNKDSIIKLYENQNLKNNDLEYFINVKTTNNGKKTYFNNDISLHGYKRNYTSELNNSAEIMSQKMSSNMIKIENRLTILKPISQNITLNISNNTGVGDLPEKLYIAPTNYIDSLFNYNYIDQSSSQKGFYSISNIGSRFNIGNFYISLDNGYKLQHNVYSTIFNNNVTFENDLKWQLFQTYIKNGIYYKMKSLSISVSVPFYITKYNHKDFLSGNNLHSTYNVWNPLLGVSLKLKHGHSFDLSVGKDNKLGNPQTIIPNYFFQNYRTIISNNNYALQMQTTKNASLGYTYKRILKGQSGGFFITTSKTTYTTIQNTSYTSSELMNIDQVSISNYNKSLTLMAYFDNFLYKSKIALKFNIEAV